MFDPGLVQILVAVIGGGIGTKLMEALASAWTTRARDRRDEVDRIARQLRTAQRHAHLTLMWGRALELLAVEFGVPRERMPKLDLMDDSEGR